MKKVQISYLIRNLEASEHLENFLISAVSSILIIRAYLAIAGYPSIEFGDFHIAHMLFGGFLMLFALLASLIYLNRIAKTFAATVGGIGFGMFIDELGKFLTKDNDYHFQPTVALIYVIFVLLFLLFKMIERYKTIKPKGYAINALELVKEAIIHDLDKEEKKLALNYIKHADKKDPIVKLLAKILSEIEAIPVNTKSIIYKLRSFVRKVYRKLIKIKGFATLVILISMIVATINLLEGMSAILIVRSFSHWGHFLSACLSFIFVLFGAYAINNTHRLLGYEMFRFAVLISIFLTQFFKFFNQQLMASFGLLISIFLWNVLQTLIRQEKVVNNK